MTPQTRPSALVGEVPGSVLGRVPTCVPTVPSAEFARLRVPKSVPVRVPSVPFAEIGQVEVELQLGPPPASGLRLGPCNRRLLRNRRWLRNGRRQGNLDQLF